MIEGGYFHSCFPECPDCKVTRLEKEVQQFRLVAANSRAQAAEAEKLREVARAAERYVEIIPKTMSGDTCAALGLPLTGEVAAANSEAGIRFQQLRDALAAAQKEKNP